MEEAVRKVIENRQSVRSTVIEDLSHQTLNRYVQNAMKGSQLIVGYSKSRMVFNKAQ